MTSFGTGKLDRSEFLAPISQAPPVGAYNPKDELPSSTAAMTSKADRFPETLSRIGSAAPSPAFNRTRSDPNCSQLDSSVRSINPHRMGEPSARMIQINKYKEQIAGVSANLREERKKRVTIEKEFESCQTELSDLKSKLVDTEFRRDELEEQLEHLEFDKNDLEDDLARQQERMALVHAETVQLSKQYDDMQAEHKATTEELQLNHERIRSELNAELIQVKCKVDETSAALSAARAKAAEMDAAGKDHQAETARYMTQLDELDDQRVALEHQKQELEHKNVYLEERRGHLEAELQSTSTKLGEMTERERIASTENAKLEKKNEEQATVIATNTETIATLRYDIDDKVRTLAEKEAQIEREMADRAKVEGAISALEEELTSVKEEYEAQMEDLRQEVTDANTSCVQVQRELSDLQTEHQDITNEIVALRENHAHLLDVFDEELQNRDDHEERVAKLTDEHAAAAAQIERLVSTREALEKEIQDKMLELEFGEHELDEKAYDMDLLTEELANIDHALNEEVAAHIESNRKLAQAQEELVAKSQQVVELDAKIESLEQNLAEETRSRVLVEDHLEAEREANKNHQETIEVTKTQLAETQDTLATRDAAHAELEQTHEETVAEGAQRLAERDAKIAQFEQELKSVCEKRDSVIYELRETEHQLQQAKALYQTAQERIASDTDSTTELRASVAREIQRGEALDAKLAAAVEQTAELGRELNQERSERSSLQTAKSQIEEAWKASQQQLESAQSSFMELKEKHAATSAALEGRVSSLTRDVERFEDLVKELRSEVAKLQGLNEDSRTHNAELGDSLKDEKREHANTQEKLQDARERIEMIAQDLQSTQASRDALDATTKDLTQQLSEARDNAANIESVLVDLKQCHADMTAHFETEKARADSLAVESEDLQKRLGETADQLEAAVCERDDARTQNTQLEADIANLESVKHELEETVSSHLSAIEELQDASRRTQERSEATDVDLEAARAKIANLEQDVETTTAELSHTTEMLESAYSSMEEMHDKIEQLESNVTDMSEQLAESQRNGSEKDSRIAEISSSLSESNQVLAETKSTLITSEELVAMQKDELTQTLTLVERMTSQCNDTESALAESQQKLQDASQQIAGLNENIADNKELLRQADLRDTKAQAEIVAVENVNTEIRAQLDAAHRERDERVRAAEAERVRSDKANAKVEKLNEALLEAQREVMQQKSMVSSAESASEDFRQCLEDEAGARARAQEQLEEARADLEASRAEGEAAKHELEELRRKMSTVSSEQSRTRDAANGVRAEAEKDRKRVQKLMQALSAESKRRREQKEQFEKSMAEKEAENDVIRTELVALKENGADAASENITGLRAQQVVSDQSEVALQKQLAFLQKKIRDDGKSVQAAKKAERETKQQFQHAEQSLKMAHVANEEMRQEFAETEAKLNDELARAKEDLESMRKVQTELMSADVTAPGFATDALAETISLARQDLEVELDDPKQKRDMLHRLKTEKLDLTVQVSDLAKQLEQRDAKIEQLVNTIDGLSGVQDQENRVSTSRPAGKTARGGRGVGLARRSTAPTKPRTPNFATTQRSQRSALRSSKNFNETMG
jgi:chromosome segregation ATPase